VPASMRTPTHQTRALSAGGREVRLRRFCCRVIGGPDSGLVRASDGAELMIGTSPGNHLLLDDPTVSRHHCTIQVTDDGFLLRDLDSTNGTTLGGFRVQAAFVESGAIIGVGRTAIRFDALDEELSEPLSAEESFGAVLGASAAMRRVFAVLDRVADTGTTILLEGETGTGKGALAEEIHARSGRRDGPFVVVDCGAIPPTLLETELFGHERGAFTDAHDTRQGAFEQAAGGTVFLDEIGELGLDVQPKLLRVLEKRVVKRVGADRSFPVDVRIIAATNRDLRHEVNRGTFRADLFYRLNVLRLELPPLRDRRDDIGLLAAHFYRALCPDPDGGLPPELLARFARHTWPGNVRELRSAVERAVLTGDAAVGATTAGEAPREAELDYSVSFRDAKERAVARWERVYVRELVRRFDGNLSRAARAVSMDRNHLRELLRRYDEE
jgi:DNA-binding NtrC family response regulator